MNIMNDIEKKVREIIGEIITSNELDIWKLQKDDNLFHYGLDSMSAVSLIVYLEDAFSFEFPEDDLTTDNIKTIERIVSYVSKKSSE